DVEVALVVEDAGVDQLVLGIALAATVLDQALIREGALRVLVQGPAVGMGRGGVEEVVQLLDVLAVVALGARQAEEPLLEDRIPLVPQGHGEAEPPLPIADAEEPVLAPAVGAAAGMVVGKIVPALAGGRVVLAHRPPLAVRQIRTEALPVAR